MVQIKKNLKRVGKVFVRSAYALMLYVASLGAIEGIPRLYSPKISDQSQLESLLSEERERVGIGEDVVIHASLGKTDHGSSQAKRIGDNKYEIILEAKGRNLNTLRHELYHIADGHCDGEPTAPNSIARLGWFAKYFFVEEPQAALYAATGIKL